jgi:hypothetical protein
MSMTRPSVVMFDHASGEYYVIDMHGQSQRFTSITQADFWAFGNALAYMDALEAKVECLRVENQMLTLRLEALL